jgi:hypothetical protein
MASFGSGTAHRGPNPISLYLRHRRDLIDAAEKNPASENPVE